MTCRPVVSFDYVESLLDQFEINALNIFNKTLSRVFQTWCHVNKASFSTETVHSKWKMWMLSFEQKVSIDAEDSQVCL